MIHFLDRFTCFYCCAGGILSVVLFKKQYDASCPRQNPPPGRPICPTMSRGSLRVSRRKVLDVLFIFFSWLGTYFLFCYNTYTCCPQFTGVCNIDIDIASLEMLFF